MMWRREGRRKRQEKGCWVNQSEVREERFDEEAWNRKMKRWEDWVKRYEKIFGESQWMWGEVWGYLGPFPSHGSEEVAMVGTRGERRYSLSPVVGIKVGDYRAGGDGGGVRVAVARAEAVERRGLRRRGGPAGPAGVDTPAVPAGSGAPAVPDGIEGGTTGGGRG